MIHAPPAGACDGFVLCGVRELLACAAPHLPAGLVDAAARVRLAALPSVLPPALAIGAFECRLEAGAARVDFEVCIRAAGGGRAALAAGLDRLARATAGSAQWERTCDFLRAWCDPQSVLFDAVPVVWLEFDLDAASDATPAPFVVFTLAGVRHVRGAIAPAVREGVARLSGGRVDGAALATLRRCCDALPCGAALLHLALRPAARAALLRAIFRLPSPGLPGYLGRVGWTGSPDELRAWLAASGPSTLMHSVNLDLGAAVGPRVGIEYFYPSPPASGRRWRTLFDALVAGGACTAARRAQLAAWPSSSGAGERGFLRLQRELLVKVVYETGAPLRAKAYLPFGARLAWSTATPRPSGQERTPPPSAPERARPAPSSPPPPHR
jgi:hypothetical protein